MLREQTFILSLTNQVLNLIILAVQTRSILFGETRAVDKVSTHQVPHVAHGFLRLRILKTLKPKLTVER